MPFWAHFATLLSSKLHSQKSKMASICDKTFATLEQPPSNLERQMQLKVKVVPEAPGRFLLSLLHRKLFISYVYHYIYIYTYILGEKWCTGQGRRRTLFIIPLYGENVIYYSPILGKGYLCVPGLAPILFLQAKQVIITIIIPLYGENVNYNLVGRGTIGARPAASSGEQALSPNTNNNNNSSNSSNNN